MINALAAAALYSDCGRPRSNSEIGDYRRSFASFSIEHRNSSWMLDEPMRMISCELADLALECSRDNWDGYGAASISESTFENAFRFVASIPFDIPQPEVGATSCGDITFEWSQGNRRIVSIAVSGNGKLYYASLNGMERQYGSLLLDGRFHPSFHALVASVLG